MRSLSDYRAPSCLDSSRNPLEIGLMFPRIRGYVLKLSIKKDHFRASECAFTLIELLIVVAIIGILSAVVASNYVQAIERADVAACQQSLKTVYSALSAYRLDFNRFPLADGAAGINPTMSTTEWGCGPSANGYWSGVSTILTKRGYCSEDALYCPALRRRHAHKIEAWPGCSQPGIAGKDVPQWRFLRFAYNSAAADVGGYEGGEYAIESDLDKDVWLVRCLHLDVGSFDEERAIAFPFRFQDEQADSIKTWVGEFELTRSGSVKPRRVHQER